MAAQLPPDLLTLAEAARRLGISIDTAKRLVREGIFPGGAALRVGRQVRVSVPRLDRWLHGDTYTGVGRSIADDGSGDPEVGRAVPSTAAEPGGSRAHVA